MPAAAPFDTLDYARKLQAAGVAPAQAELQAKALGEALAGSVVTRNDLDALESRLDGRFAAIDARFASLERGTNARFANLDARFASLESSLDQRFANVDIRFTNLEARLELKIANLEARLGGKIDTLRWMFGVLVALNAGVFIQLFLKH